MSCIASKLTHLEKTNKKTSYLTSNPSKEYHLSLILHGLALEALAELSKYLYKLVCFLQTAFFPLPTKL